MSGQPDGQVAAIYSDSGADIDHSSYPVPLFMMEDATQPIPAVRVVLAEDHASMRELVEYRLARSPHIQLVGEAGSAPEAIEMCTRLAPAVLILDIDLLGPMNGIDAVPLLRQAAPKTRILFWSGSCDEALIVAALRAGPEGFVEKANRWQTLVGAVLAVASGGSFHCKRAGQLLREMAAGQHPLTRPKAALEAGLTLQEKRVLKLIASGLSTKEAATQLGLSPMTVGTHRRSLMGKLGVHNAAGLIRHAVSRRLLAAAAKVSDALRR